jgi:hypothetical protein
MQDQRQRQTPKEEAMFWPGTSCSEGLHLRLEYGIALVFLPHPDKAV